MTVTPASPVAFVLSGGASLGAIQVGMLQALAQKGIRPDLIVSSSVGSLNAALLALDPEHGADRLERIWLDVRRHDIFPLEPMRLALTIAARTPSLVSARGLDRLVRRHLRSRRFDDLAVPLHVIATDQQTGEAVALHTGSVVDAVLASAAIPGVFRARVLGDRSLVDGGIAANCPMLPALQAGAKTLVVLDASGPCVLTEPPRTAIESVLAGLGHLTRSQTIAHTAKAATSGATVIYLPTPCTTQRSPLDFSGTASLIARARGMALDFLAELDDGATLGPGLVGHPHIHRY